MEIKFKITLPSIITGEESNQNQAQCKIPKTFQASFMIDFDSKSIPSIKSAETSSPKKFVLYVNKDNNDNCNEKKDEHKEEIHAEENCEKKDHPESEGLQPISKGRNEEPMSISTKIIEENYENEDNPKSIYKETNNAVSILPPIKLVEKHKENDKGNFNFSEEVNEDIYIVGIKDNMTEEDLKNAFSKYGEVMDIKIFKDRFTQKIKGAGIIKFKDKKSSFNAVNDGDEVLCKGYALKLRYSRRNKIYGQRDDARNKDGQKFCGRIRERNKEAAEEGEILYNRKC